MRSSRGNMLSIPMGTVGGGGFPRARHLKRSSIAGSNRGRTSRLTEILLSRPLEFNISGIRNFGNLVVYLALLFLHKTR